eukprot:1130914-Heterocapsa_arctica.AAC.1
MSGRMPCPGWRSLGGLVRPERPVGDLNIEYPLMEMTPLQKTFLHRHGLKGCADVLLSEVGHDGPQC